VTEKHGPVVELHVVSDSTGETATRVVAAVEAQFPGQAFATVRHPRVETVADLQLALARMEPRAQPPLDEQYFRRIAAIEYAVKSDDGLGRALPNAEIVLVGVSRTSKTPLSMYLGYLGWKVANVPIVLGIEPPPELFEVDPARVVGLTIEARRLSEIRAERIQLMGGDRRYASLPEIYEELDYAAGIHRRLGCPVIDVSELSIEEIAQRILRAVARRTNEATLK
jgi:regulator of PEP synthase PpsR (kinase-PPPase family)